MLRKPTTSETGVDLAAAMIPTKELIGGAKIVAFIEHMAKRRGSEITLADIKAQGDERIELVLIERHVDRSVYRVHCNLSILDEPLRSLVLCTGRVRTNIRASVAPSDCPNTALIFVRA